MNRPLSRIINFQAEVMKRILSAPTPSLDGDSAEKGWQVYRQNRLFTAARSLSISYPVVKKMLGPDAMKVLAKRLLDSNGPATGDWAEWGGTLAQLLRDSELMEPLPFLADMAELEWCVHLIKRAGIDIGHPTCIDLLHSQALDTVRFTFQKQGLILGSSEFPVVALWQAHRPWDEDFIPDDIVLADIFSAGVLQCHYQIHQHGYIAHVKEITLSEYRWMEDVAKGFDVARLIDRHLTFDIVGWLQKASELDGLIYLEKICEGGKCND
ncbi:putative DNA-binding domain-containing protein [Teredinibacter turnerae]|uniref:HvfC/BufC family peptide modification chaperone n=1 Tax=Teredinibacter turnerae TaxID=2426 RepID=UPI0005F7ECB7|nr:putative DNA-binding domain-containing protein [Teredinibacter turnerae]